MNFITSLLTRLLRCKKVIFMHVHVINNSIIPIFARFLMKYSFKIIAALRSSTAGKVDDAGLVIVDT